MDRNDALNHFGVLGMKWGKRKSGANRLSRKERNAIKIEVKYKKRNETLNNVLKKDPTAAAKIGKLYLQQGERSVSRVLDIMGKEPTKNLKKAMRQQAGERVAKKVLISIGASALGVGLSKIGK